MVINIPCLMYNCRRKGMTPRVELDRVGHGGVCNQLVQNDAILLFSSKSR